MIKPVKIGLAGGMASGKTTVGNKLALNFNNCQLLSFAAPVKDMATNLFGMHGKDRKLLQGLGTAYRRVDTDVWVKLLIDKFDSKYEAIIVDDVRYENEAIALKAHGFTIIWLETPLDARISRIKNKYGIESDEHILGLKHCSETCHETKSLADVVYDTHYMSSTSIASSIWDSISGDSVGRTSAASLDKSSLTNANSD